MVRPNCLLFDDGGKVNFPFEPSAKPGGNLAKSACLVGLAAGGR